MIYALLSPLPRVRVCVFSATTLIHNILPLDSYFDSNTSFCSRVRLILASCQLEAHKKPKQTSHYSRRGLRPETQELPLLLAP